MRAEPGRLYEVFTFVRPLHQLSARVVAASIAPYELSVPVRAVLERLSSDGPQTVPQIARSLLVPRQVAQRLADEAAGRGLVAWAPNPAHRRSKLAELTSAGRSLYAEIHTAELERLQPAADDLSADEVATCVRVMSRLLVELRKLDQQASSQAASTSLGRRT